MMSTHPFNVGLTKIKYEVSTAKSSQIPCFPFLWALLLSRGIRSLSVPSFAVWNRMTLVLDRGM